MKKAKPSQLDLDGQAIGFAIRDGWIIPLNPAGGPAGGLLAGAKVTVDQAIGEPSTWAKLNTPMSRRGTVQGKATMFITVTCADGVTLITERQPKHQLAARRWAAQVNAMAVAAP